MESKVLWWLASLLGVLAFFLEMVGVAYFMVMGDWMMVCVVIFLGLSTLIKLFVINFYAVRSYKKEE